VDSVAPAAAPATGTPAVALAQQPQSGVTDPAAPAPAPADAAQPTAASTADAGNTSAAATTSPAPLDATSSPGTASPQDGPQTGGGTPTVQFASASSSAAEGSLAPITITLSAASTQTVSVHVTTSGGTAVSGTDYQPLMGTVYFSPGVTSQTVTVHTLDDNKTGETSPETVGLTLMSPSGATLGAQSSTTLNITEDDDGPWVQFAAASYSATEGQQGPATITVTLSPSSTGTVTVQYATSDGSGHAGTDYTATSGTLTFAPGVASQSFTVPVLDDYLSGETTQETVNLSLANPTGASLGTPKTATLNIGEDAPTLQWVTGSPTFTWSQTLAPPPVLSNPGNESTPEGSAVTLPVIASDPNNSPLSYDAVNLPPGLSINSTTGMISGSVSYQAAEDFNGVYPVTLVVADSLGGSASQAFTWTITDTVRPPTLTKPGDQTNLRGDNVSLQVQANQPDGDPLMYTATGLPPGLTIDSLSGLITGTVDPGAALNAPYTVTVTASDGSLTASQSFAWTVSPANQVPSLTSPGDQTNAAGDWVLLDLAGGDSDGDPVTWTATGLPAGLSIDPTSGTISGTLANSAASTTPYTVTATASDGMASASQTFHWTVNAVGLAAPGDQANVAGDSVSLQLSGTDASGLPPTYSATGLPSGLSLNTSTGLISGTLPASASSSTAYSVTVTASDGTSSASQTFQWSVAALALANPGDQTNQEGTSVSLQLSATDVGGTPTYSATGLPAGLSLNASTGLIAGTIGTAAHGSSPYSVTVTGNDGSNSSSQSFIWSVTPRVALVNPGSQGNAAGDSVSLPVSASTGGGTLTYSATGLPAGLSINGGTGLIAGTIAAGADSATPYLVTVTASDGTSSSSQTFAWAVSAVYVPPPADQSNFDDDVVSLPVTAGYHGTGTLTYSAAGLPSGLGINSSTGRITGTVANTADSGGPYLVTVTATDGSNSGSATFNWTINPRVSVAAPGDQANAAGDGVSLALSGTDEAGGTLTWSATGLPADLTIDPTTGLISGTIAVGADGSSPYAVTVTATDGIASASQTFGWTVAHLALSNPGPQISVDGAAVSLPLQGHDADGNPVSFAANGLPPGSTSMGPPGSSPGP
jgi:hypothetical protein